MGSHTQAQPHMTQIKHDEAHSYTLKGMAARATDWQAPKIIKLFFFFAP